MLITCPECQFARNISASSIPSKAQLATCPRCKTKFRFRILHDEEKLVVEGIEERPEAQPASEPEGRQSEPHGDDAVHADAGAYKEAVQGEPDAADDYVDSAMVDAMQEEIEQLLGGGDAEASVDSDVIAGAVVGDLLKELEENEQAEASESASDTAVHDAEEQADSSEHGSVSDDSADHEAVGAADNAQDESFEQSAEVAASVDETVSVDSERQEIDGIEISSAKMMDAISTEQVRDAVTEESSEAEEEAIKRYIQVQESSEREAASAHIVPAAKEKTDIWDAIAAMGEEHECTESFVPGCGAHVHILPWEDGRLGTLGRVVSTFTSLYGSPVRFWRGINAKPSALPAVLFFLLMSLIGYGIVAGWTHVLVNNWTDIYAAMQSVLPVADVLPQALVLPQLTLSGGLAAIGGALVLLLLVGGITHASARGLGGEPAPLSSGIKCVAYSCGAFVWLLLPVIGVIAATIYFPLLYVSGIRAGYNLSLFKTVVLVLTVFLLGAASVFFATAAGVIFM